MKILFPTDFSGAADHAYIYALRLADVLGAEINIVHVYDLPSLKAAHLPNTVAQVYDQITFESFENFKDHIPHLREIAARENLSHVVCHHSLINSVKSGVVQTIVRTADKLNTDFIVMGTTGASGFKEVFLGSVAAEVLENSTCPVLAVPNNALFDGSIDRIAFATEYREEDKSTLKTAATFAGWFDAELHVVHVDVSHTENYTARIYKFLNEVDDLPAVKPHVIDDNNVEHGLTEFLHEFGIDILAMRIKKRNFIQELFTYSMTKKMSNHLHVPILGLHA